jgi:hypothetical protein
VPKADIGLLFDHFISAGEQLRRESKMRQKSGIELLPLLMHQPGRKGRID